jgi:deoxyribonuclease V
LLDSKGNGERIGAAVRTRSSVQPIFVSQGHRISLRTAIQWTLRVSSGFRIPRPTRDADRLAGETKRELLATHASEN